MAEAQSLRQPGNAEQRTDLYMWAAPEQTLEGQAAALIDELLGALEAVANEARIANDVIRLKRDADGSGRVKVATAMHRIAEAANATIAKARS